MHGVQLLLSARTKDGGERAAASVSGLPPAPRRWCVQRSNSAQCARHTRMRAAVAGLGMPAMRARSAQHGARQPHATVAVWVPEQRAATRLVALHLARIELATFSVWG